MFVSQVNTDLLRGAFRHGLACIGGRMECMHVHEVRSAICRQGDSQRFRNSIYKVSPIYCIEMAARNECAAVLNGTRVAKLARQNMPPWQVINSEPYVGNEQ